MAWKIKLKTSIEKELRVMPKEEAECILSDLERISESDPRECGKKLEGTEFYSYRVSSYRIIYRIEEKEETVVVLRVGHRGSVYRNLGRLH